MIILPAIDMMSGKPVRLYKGEFDSAAQVADDVVSTARSFEQSGAQWVHMVDLDGARTGKKENAAKIVETAQLLSIPVEVGGGIRTMDDISYYLDHGVSRVILGTAAVDDRQLLKQAVSRYGEKIVVGMDCRDGYVCTKGWLNTSRIDYLDFAKQMESEGVQTLIVTDISKDGTLQGPNTQMLACLQETVSVNLIASGGIADISHIRTLCEMGIYGAITGKAVYSGSLDLKEAIRTGKGKPC
ncbi:MAG: 1-(5-phosphoribosyl)-5-[(5-phosphoribosylamino)methylideneamino]imidazole-4-carboxamide isomerase [Bulleidia sp.]